MGKLTIAIDGYGEIRVKVPKRINREAYADGIAAAVAQTMQLVTDPPPRFHPVLGMTKAR